MGDLQCPARIYLAETVAVRDVRERLTHERLAAVYEVAEPVDAVRASLQDIADRHRGEAVLIVGEGGVVSDALRGLVAGWRARALSTPDAVLALEADADGWRLVAPAEPTSPAAPTSPASPASPHPPRGQTMSSNRADNSTC